MISYDTAFSCDLTGNSFDRMAVDTKVVSLIGF